MRILKAFSPVSLAFALSACVVVPVVDREEAMPSTCKTYTRSMSLQTLELNAGCRDENCLAVALAISAGSVLISGSIVITNNTVHWLEYQGTCSGGYLNVTRQRFLDSFSRSRQSPTSWLQP